MDNEDNLKKKIEKLEKDKAELETENKLLTKAQQELKAKIKELTTDRPKITSGHQSGSVKYVRQVRVKKKTD